MSKTWVIGGTSGIGAAVCDELRQRAIRSQLQSGDVGHLASWSLCITGEERDVTRASSLADYIERHKPFDEVVYCVGIQRLGFLGDDIEDDVRDIFAANVLGFINVLDKLRGHQGTHPLSVVAIVSDASRVPMRSSIAYCASKAALYQAIRVAARETAPTWRVNGVSPGIVADTPMTRQLDRDVLAQRGWTAEQAAEYEASLIPMRRRALPQEVAHVIADVLRGPQYMTGSIVEITGGK